MKASEIGTRLDGAIRQHEMMLERLWGYRLNNSVSKIKESHPSLYGQDILQCHLVEAEARIADIQRMLLLNIPSVMDAAEEDVVKASVEILARKVQDIYDNLKMIFDDYCNNRKKLHVDTSPWKNEIDAKRESVVVWTSFDLRESILRWLKDQEVLEATLKSAKASAEAAEASKQSADANIVAARAAKTTAEWTRWAVLATAVAAIATAYSAYYTKLSAEASKTQSAQISESKVLQKPSPMPTATRAVAAPLSGQVTQQEVPYPRPVSTGKAK